MRRFGIVATKPLPAAGFTFRGLFQGPRAAIRNAIPKPPRERKVMKLKDNRPIIQGQRARNSSLEKEAADAKLDWRLVVATIIHRFPVITPDPQPWEVEFQEMKDAHNLIKRETLFNLTRDTAADILPERLVPYEEILKSMPFTPAPRVSEADEKNDRRSLDRKLQESLFLIVKRNRGDHQWQFPQGKVLENEATLRSTAERVMDRATGRLDRYFMSNAPIGHYSYAYPKEMQKTRKQFGARVFFYRCQYMGGTFRLETKLYKDYAWIARSELGEYFDKDTAEYLHELLPMF